MRLLVTRPREDADALAAALREIGAEPVLTPLLTIEPAPDMRVDLDGVQAILFTSANGVRVFAAKSDARNLPVFAVGDATARAAAETGFKAIESAGGDTHDLAALVASTLDPKAGALLHPAGRDVAGPLKQDLEAREFSVRRETYYRATVARTLPDEARRAIGEQSIDGVLLFSPRTAQTFVSLVREAALSRALENSYAYCLSAAVAEIARDVQWKNVRIAAEPTQAALLDLIAADLRARP